MTISSKQTRALLLGISIFAAACDATTTEPASTPTLKPSLSATSTLNEFPVNVNFQFYSVCLDARVTLSGTAYWSVRTVVRPDGSRHLTILMDVSGPTLSAGGSVWTAHRGASEMFVRNIPAGGILGVDDQQTEHQGTVIYKSADGRPDLRFVHRIHLVRLPGTDEVQINHNIFEIVCVGQSN